MVIEFGCEENKFFWFQVAEQKGGVVTPTIVTETMLDEILGVILMS